jgi:hypothetical protein
MSYLSEVSVFHMDTFHSDEKDSSSGPDRNLVRVGLIYFM